MTPPNPAPASEWPESKLAEIEKRIVALSSGRLCSETESVLSHQMARTDLPEAVAEIRRLRAEVVELRKDRERLDWLEENCGFQVGILRHGECFGNVIEVDINNGPSGEGKTLRAAIDVAKEPAKVTTPTSEDIAASMRFITDTSFGGE